jgi:hypothetical protein
VGRRIGEVWDHWERFVPRHGLLGRHLGLRRVIVLLPVVIGLMVVQSTERWHLVVVGLFVLVIMLSVRVQYRDAEVARLATLPPPPPAPPSMGGQVT